MQHKKFTEKYGVPTSEITLEEEVISDNDRNQYLKKLKKENNRREQSPKT